jgi:uncharacterized protein (TIGR02599 family)
MKALSLPARKYAGFSLIELLVSVAVLSLVMVLVFQMLERTQVSFKKARDSVSEYKDARNGFDAITRRLSQATLNTFWQVNKNSSNVATKFQRESDLHYISGPASVLLGAPPPDAGERTTHAMFFQSPTGYSEVVSKTGVAANSLEYGNFSNLLNGWGYFVEFGTDTIDRPQYLNSLDNAPRPRARFRLMEFSQVAERLQIYAEQLRSKTTGQSTAAINKWFLNDTNYGVNFSGNYKVTASDQNGSASNSILRTTRLIAENIIALVVLPAESLSANYRDQLAPNYYYDTRAWQGGNSGMAGGQTLVEKTRHVLPPIVDVTMVAVDEADFRKVTQLENIDSVSGFSTVNFTKDLFKVAKNYDKDLETLRNTLSNHKPEIKFRVFRASVRLREAKWGGFADTAAAAN